MNEAQTPLAPISATEPAAESLGVASLKSLTNLRRNSWYSVLSMVLRLGVTIISIPVLIRSLGLAQYGIWTVLLSVVNVAALAQLGLDSAVTYHVAHTAADTGTKQRDQVLSSALLMFSALGLIVATIIIVGAPIIVHLLFPSSLPNLPLVPVVIIFGGVAILQFWKQWAVAAEAGLLRYDIQASAESASTLFTYGGLIVIAWLGFGLLGLATWFLTAGLVALCIHAYLLHRAVGLRFDLAQGWNRTHAVSLFRFGITQWTAQIGGTLFGQGDRILVNYFLGPAAAGLYSVATSVAARINEFSSVPIQLIVPAISMAQAKEDSERAGAIFARAQRLNGLIVYILSAAIILGSTFLARILVTTADAEDLAPALRIIALVYGLYSLNAPGFFVAMGIGRPAINAGWSLLAGFLSILFLIFLTPRYSLHGAAWANIGYVATLAINWHVIRELRLGFLTSVMNQLPAFCCVILCWLVSMLLVRFAQPLWLCIIVSVALVVGSVAWVGGRELLWETHRALALVRKFGSNRPVFRHVS